MLCDNFALSVGLRDASTDDESRTSAHYWDVGRGNVMQRSWSSHEKITKLIISRNCKRLEAWCIRLTACNSSSWQTPHQNRQGDVLSAQTVRLSDSVVENASSATLFSCSPCLEGILSHAKGVLADSGNSTDEWQLLLFLSAIVWGVSFDKSFCSKKRSRVWPSRTVVACAARHLPFFEDRSCLPWKKC